MCIQRKSIQDIAQSLKYVPFLCNIMILFTNVACYIAVYLAFVI